MIKKFCLIIIGLLISWGQYCYADSEILYPEDDYDTFWFPSTGSDRWAMVDDPAGSPDDWTTYVYTVTLNARNAMVFQNTSFTTIDSLYLFVRAACFGGNGIDTLELGYILEGETPSWQEICDVVITTTITNFTCKLTGEWSQSTVNSRVYGFAAQTPEEQQWVTQCYLTVYGEAAPPSGKPRQPIVRDIEDGGGIVR